MRLQYYQIPFACNITLNGSFIPASCKMKELWELLKIFTSEKNCYEKLAYEKVLWQYGRVSPPHSHLIPRYLVTFAVRCAIWCRLYSLKNVKNTHGGVLILVHSFMGVFHVFQIVQMVPNRATHHIYRLSAQL